MKVYTRTGDDGTTGLFGGGRVGKDSARVAAYGAVDEANSALGVARADLAAHPELSALDRDLQELQSLLFDVGADLATPSDAKTRSYVTPITDQDATALERMIDRYSAELPELRTFVLPAGTRAAASLHVARSVVRRAEREAVALAGAEEVNAAVVVVLNRISDLLFTIARVANVRLGQAEVAWTARSGSERAGAE